MALAAHLVGRASELGSRRPSPRADRRGTIRGARARRRARNRQDAPARRAGRPCRRTRRTSSSPAGPASSSSTCRSGSSSTRSTSTSTASTHTASKRLDGDVRAELATVFPSLAGLATGRRTAIQHERYRSHRAVCVLLETLAQTQPVVLVLDDVHWADPASVELLGALLHRPPAAQVLIALAVRPRQMGERLSAAVERAHRAGTIARIELGALSLEEARELIGDGADATSLYEDSGGNPFYLEQLARSADRPDMPAPPGELSLAGVDVPAAVAAALAEELALLSKPARLILEGAAVAGDPFDPELAAAAAGAAEAAAIDAIDELLRLDLVRQTDVPRRFRFRHPLVRRAVYESMPGGWRLGAHERCAEALALRGSPASAIAHHVERSARQGDEAAIALLREAGEAAAPRAPASAARWFAAALRLLPAAAPGDRRVELLLARSEALAATGQLGESHAALLESMNIVPQEAESLRVRLTAACARVEHLLGRYNEAHAHLETALAELRDPDSAQGVELMIELAGDSLYHGDYDAMRAWASRAVEAAALLGDQALIAAALAVRALASAVGGRAAEGQAYCAEAAALIDGLADDELGRSARRARASRHGRVLPRPLRGGRAPRRARAANRSRDREGRSLPAHRPHARRQPLGSRPDGGGRRGARRRDRSRAAGRQPPGPRLEPLQPLLRSVRRRRHRPSARDRKGGVRSRAGARPRSRPCARGGRTGLRTARDGPSRAVRRVAGRVRRRATSCG